MLGAAALLGLHTSASALSIITVDERLAPGDVNAAYLSGNVWMALSGSQLTITLQNTSTRDAGSGAGVVLTGLGFNLPDGMSISGGSAVMGSPDIAGTLGNAINFIKPAGGNVSQEWGYDTSGLDSGALIGHSVNNSISSMESQTTDQFQNGSLVPPPNLDGPDMGLLSAAFTAADLGTGVEAIQDTLTVTLNLSGTYSGDLLAFIDSGNVALTFGSPGGTPSVPDGGSTLSLLGASLVGLQWFARRRKGASCK